MKQIEKECDTYCAVYQKMYDDFGIKIEWEPSQKGVFIQLNAENWGYGCCNLSTVNGIVNFLDRRLWSLRREAIES